MNREYIKDKFMKNRHINTQSSLYGCELIDNIFDNFESRKCINCKYYVEYKCKNPFIFNNSIIDGQANLIDFGCIKFEYK